MIDVVMDCCREDCDGRVKLQRHGRRRDTDLSGRCPACGAMNIWVWHRAAGTGQRETGT